MTHFKKPLQPQLGPNPTKREVDQLWGKFNTLRRVTDERFYVSFNLRGGRKGAWPILFATRAGAQAAIDTLPIFQNTHLAGIKSACVERTTVTR